MKLFRRIPAFLKNISCLYLICTILLLVVVDKRIEYGSKSLFDVSNIVIIIICLLLFGGLLLLYLKYKKQLQFHLSKKHIMIIFICVFVIQFLIAKAIYFKTGWDVKVIQDAAERLSEGNMIEDFYYFSRYPNNVALTYLLYLCNSLESFLHIGNNTLTLFITCLSVNVSCLMSTLIIKKLVNENYVVIISMILSMTLIVFSPWIVIPYTDSLGILFPITALYIYIYMTNKTWLKWLAICTITFVGYLIKPTCVILLIALFMIEACYWIQGKDRVKKAVLFGCCVVVGFAFSAGMKRIAYHNTGYAPNKDAEFTLTHFLMMGLNTKTNGIFYEGDVVRSRDEKTVAKRQEMNLNVSAERMKELGITGYLDLLIRKNLTNYNDGTFAWSGEGTFYQDVKPTNNPIKKVVREYYYDYEDGNVLHKIYYFKTQIAWIMVLLGCGLCLIKGKANIRYESVILLSIFGLSVFLLLFEARSRYLFLYTPFYVIAFAIGFSKLLNYVERRVRRM